VSNATPRIEPAPAASPTFGSDAIADMLRALDFDYIALTPGASLRGLHDSLVNHLGNANPRILLCVHEEHAVAIAHGYARVTGRPMAVALHANVGLMHATMAIFNAWCDRIPVFMLGGVGPMDAVKRRPWVDWIHTSRDLGALVRGYVEVDDQPGSVAAALGVVRAYRISTTAPCGPVFVNLDATIQEEPSHGVPMPPLDRFPPAVTGDPPADAVAAVAAMLAKARRPLLMIGRVSSDPGDFHRRVQLAERLDARVLTDLKTGASFPTMHRLHPHAPGLYVSSEAGILIREADVIVSLDWVDLAGSLRQACGGETPTAKIVQCSVDQYSHHGWNMDYQSLPQTDVTILSSPDRLVSCLLATIEERAPRPSIALPAPAVSPSPGATGDAVAATEHLSIDALAQTTVDALAAHRPSYIRLPLGWPGEYCRFEHPQDYIGFDGGGGIGSGPGMAVDAALALRGGDRLPVAIVGDGDYLMGLTALWTGVHNRVPLLMIVSNNQSFFNDELHQERVARTRGRPIENRWIGLRMDGPRMNLATLAQGQGAIGLGPVRTVTDLQQAIETGVARVRDGALCVIDVHVAPEYARAMSSSLMRHISTTS
jgi:thiamine pyrophosphate-dependent acetolactate synthase large subunit-like protein